jgi:magnesium transporter
MITYYFRSVKDVELKTLTEPRSGVWVHVTDPTKADIKLLEEQFGLDEDVLEDAQDFFEVPRVERVGSHTYFFTRYPYHDDVEDTDTAPLMIVVGETFVLTFAQRPVPQFERIISGKLPIVTTQKSKLFIQFMTAIIRSFDVELVRLRRAVHKDRGRLREIGMRGVERLVQFENRLNGIVEALMPSTQWLQLVSKGNYLQLYSDDVEDMQDLVIDANQVVDSARSILKTLQNMRGGLEAILSSRLNNSLSILTVLTILLTVPLVIASVYGMNVALPFQKESWAFYLILGINVAALVVLAIIFRKKRWF